MQARTRQLHRIVFDDAFAGQFDALSVRASRLAYAGYHKLLRDAGFGRDESSNPRLQSQAILEWPAGRLSASFQ